MISYITRRIAELSVVLLIVSFICFGIFQYLGDPVLAVVGYRYANPKVVAEARQRLGLDKPIYVQYLRFISKAVRSDFGFSYTKIRPVLNVIADRIPATLELVVVATAIAILLGGVLGVIAGVKPHSVLSKSALVASLFGISIPTFLSGLLLIMLFAVTLGWFPAFGRGQTVRVGFWTTGFLTRDGLLHLVLPAITLALYQLAMILRLVRAEMVEVLSHDYVRSAWAKGLPRVRVICKHALRNALIPVVTVVGLQFGEMLGFSIVTETVFQWPGLGKLLIDTLYNNDSPVIVVYIIFMALVISLINLAVDIGYVFLDPRICYD
ncbi:ABC transporter permease [Candidatus Bipolaricaulota bacterium]|nr:ABC transporter permease [Candidatus Bipolaricaulota bacterium]